MSEFVGTAESLCEHRGGARARILHRAGSLGVGGRKAWPIDRCPDKAVGEVGRETPTACSRRSGVMTDAHKTSVDSMKEKMC